MTTECSTGRLEFAGLRRQRVVGRFDGGELGSDGGGLLLRELALRTGLFRRLSACFRDHRDPRRTQHALEVLLAARVLGLALGYEDLNDHDTLRQSRLWSLLCGAAGRGRRRASWEGWPPGKSTLNRLELTGAALGPGERCKKIVADTARLDALLADLFLDWHGAQPERIVLDVDATDDPLHGRQEGRFFHGYCRSYCYLPLYIFCGQQLLGARLRTADRDAAEGTVQELERIAGRLRERWPGVEIRLRGDSGFCREELLAWCEAQGVEYVLGIAQNARLKRSLIGKAEHLPRGANPRFVVTSLGAGRMAARTLYEQVYCARGDMENRIKEQQLALFADRTSAHTMRANQLRLYFASFAYALLELLRRRGLRGTRLARAQCGTIRLKLLKIGVRIRVSVRAVRLSFDEGFPEAGLFGQVLARLQSLPLRC